MASLHILFTIKHRLDAPRKGMREGACSIINILYLCIKLSGVAARLNKPEPIVIPYGHQRARLLYKARNVLELKRSGEISEIMSV